MENEEQEEQAEELQKEAMAAEINKMGVMPIGKLMRIMSIPAMLSMIVQSLYSIVNSIFLGFLGQDALAAVTLIFPVQLFIIAFGAGTGVGLNSLISRRLGERRQSEASSAASHGLLLSFVNWCIFVVFGLFFAGPFIRLFSDNPAIVENAVIYCQITTIGSLFIFVQANVEKILQATGNMVFPMISSITGAVTNVIINPILIFGLLGAPRMGMPGSATGTVIAQFLSMSIGLILLFGKKHEIKISFKGFKLNWVVIKNIYAVGIPSIIMQSIGCVMLIGLNSILISFSEAAVAVLGVYYRIQSLIFMPVFGLTQGAMPIFGYNYGARNKERLLEAFKLALKVAVLIMAAGIVIFQLFPVQLLNLFSASTEMMDIGVRALRIISTCFIFSAIGIIAATLFQATGYGLLSSIVSVLRQLVLILPLAWILGKLFGLEYIWLSFPMAELFSVAASLFFLQYIYRKDIKNL